MSDAATNKSIVRRFLGAVRYGDLDTIEALQAPDCTWWVVGGGDMTRAEYTDAVKGMLLTASTRKVEIIGIICEGDTVAADMQEEIT
mgnify:FL=1